MPDDRSLPPELQRVKLGNLRDARAKVQAQIKKNQDAARAQTEQTLRSRSVFVEEICLMVNDLDLFLEEFEVQDGKRNRRRSLKRFVPGDGKQDRRRLLERSVLLSIRDSTSWHKNHSSMVPMNITIRCARA